MERNDKYIRLLSEKYPTMRSLLREIINLSAILNLPKGTEHFMSDIHGEYEAFCHILNNCAGVIREKADMLYGDRLSDIEIEEICTIIYYPKEKLSLIKKERVISPDRYRLIINRMIEIAGLLSSKYTRSKVRKAMPKDYAYIIDELLHAQKDEDDNQILYHEKILDSIIGIDADDFICALAGLIKRLAVDHLHIVGDIFDRGANADKILDLLMGHHSLDIQWGNHDILWIGAAAGNEACIANVVRNCIKYDTLDILESRYGISLRKLTVFAGETYKNGSITDKALKAISVIQFKAEGQIILRHPEYEMKDRLLLDKIDKENGNIIIDGNEYKVNDTDLPTVGGRNPYSYTDEETEIISSLKTAFINSSRLQKHIRFIIDKGSMYLRYNDNLLYHGCIPLDESGNFYGVKLFNGIYKGKALLDIADKTVRRVYYHKNDGNIMKAEILRQESYSDELDLLWYLWSGRRSPLCGRNIKTFERYFIDDKSAWHEESDPYYSFYETEKCCSMILREFDLYSPYSHIINGHTPVLVSRGEQPIKANGMLLVIDGGFCRDYHSKTGIAGYTLIFNSHGLRIKAHQPFESIEKALSDNMDIISSSQLIETEKNRIMVKDTDNGKRIMEEIDDLYELLLYRRSVD